MTAKIEEIQRVDVVILKRCLRLAFIEENPNFFSKVSDAHGR